MESKEESHQIVFCREEMGWGGCLPGNCYHSQEVTEISPKI